MPDETHTEELPAVLDRLKKLQALALDSDNEESRTAAVQAMRLIRDNKLVVVPETELAAATKAVQGARQDLVRVARAAKAQQNKQMIMGAGLGLLVSKFIKF